MLLILTLKLHFWVPPWLVALARRHPPVR